MHEKLSCSVNCFISEGNGCNEAQMVLSDLGLTKSGRENLKEKLQNPREVIPIFSCDEKKTPNITKI